MRRLTTILGYTGAALTVLAALATPFVLYELFTGAVAATGIQVDPVYSGGQPSHTLDRGEYKITVYRPVVPQAPLSRVGPFVQIVWTPARALPARVEDEVDIDRDGRADLVARFDVPRDEGAALTVDVTPTGADVLPLRQVSRDSFSSLIARVGARIVLRVPLARGSALSRPAAAAAAAPA